jgi:hypothetical protein
MLADDARAQNRPPGETAGLEQLAAQIDDLLARTQSASQRPDGAGQVASLSAQLNQTAAQGARAEAATLQHAGQTMADEATSTLRGGGAPAGAAQALAALQGSTQQLDAAVASVGSATGAAGALGALHGAFTALGQVRTDYAAAAALYPPALRARFDAVADAARAAAQRVIAAANAPKPWLFASRSQKDAYKALQDNAAEARRDLSELDRLAQAVGRSTDVRQLRAANAQAGQIRSSLGALAAAPRPLGSGR